MKNIFFSLLAFLSICFISHGQKYYTLNSGNWNNTTTVWSLDGITPCSCFPGNSLLTDTIFVNNPINLTSNVSASSLSKIEINTTGALSNSTFDLFISNSIVLANGSISVRNLNIGLGGNFEISSSSLLVNLNLDVAGILKSSLSNITIINGNIQVSSTGSVLLENNSMIHFFNGNYKNNGLTSICSTCCISLDAGNIQNETTGTFNGNGSVISSSGNIKNYGIWNPTLKWCALGASVGMTSIENCITANANCTFAPLPIDLLNFDGYHQENKNIIFWETASENNSNYFQLNKSKDGTNWSLLTIIEAQGFSSGKHYYEYTDEDETDGINYYNLSQFDLNGHETLDKTISLINEQSSFLTFYPNPSDDKVNIQLKTNNPYKSISILDASGRKLNQLIIGDALTFEIQLPYQIGIYFIRAEGEQISNTFKLMKL